MSKRVKKSYVIKDDEKKISDVGQYVDVVALLEDFFKLDDEFDKEHEKAKRKVRKLLS